ncbi:MAG: hypothetical protein JO099_13330 [Acidobacteriia bacterium]|nr:hypothetical protein [Terriglobia bacterium]
MNTSCAKLAVLATLAVSCGWPATTSTGLSASPTSVNFSYTVGSSTLPASQNLTLSLPTTVSSSTLIDVAVQYPVGTPASQQGWLTIAGAPGVSPLKLTVLANPTGLPPGTLNATIQVSTTPSTTTLAVSVTLAIANPPATLQLSGTNLTPASGTSPASLTFSYTTGVAWSVAPSEVDVTTNGGTIPFNVSVANASSSASSSTPVWLRVAPQGSVITSTQTSGYANGGSSVPIMVSIDQTTVQTLLPGAYEGTVTFAASSTSNGTQVVDVNLIISAGPPTIGSIFPTSITQISPTATDVINPLITVNGTNFFSTSVVTLAPAGTPAGGQCTQTGNPTQVAAQLLSQNIMTATISNAQTLFQTSQPWCICVTNPAPPNNPSQAPACTPTGPPDYTFWVLPSSQVAVSTVTNAASYQQTSVQPAPNPVSPGQTSVAPGEIISIFGQNLGPATPTTAPAAATPAVVSSITPVGATLDTLDLGATTLQFTVNPGHVSVVVNFANPSCPAHSIAETLANVIACINTITTATAGILQNMASSYTVNGHTYITLTSPATGSTAGITVTDNAAAVLLNLTNGSGAVTGSGAQLAFPTTFRGVQVAFQFGTAPAITTVFAPIIMISNNQVNAMAPFELQSGVVAGQTAALFVQNGSSAAPAFPAAPPASGIVLVHEDPGIFTLTGEGTGQAAVLNYSPDTGSYTLNSAKNTAARGSTIVIYATGLGVLQAPGVADGVPAATPDKIVDPVQVTIGEQPSVVSYAGTSGGSIGGLTQINAIVPPTVIPGQAVSLTISGGATQATARTSPAGVTIAVK